MHFSIVELKDLSSLICVLRLLICPCHLSCPAVLPASLGCGAERCCKVSMAALKGTTDLILRAELCQGCTSCFCLTQTVHCHHFVKTYHVTWPFSPPHQTQHIQKLCLTLHALQKSTSMEELLRLFSSEDIIEEVILKDKSILKHCVMQNKMNV